MNALGIGSASIVCGPEVIVIDLRQLGTTERGSELRFTHNCDKLVAAVDQVMICLGGASASHFV